MTMGEKILNMRKARGWNQEELAERIGVTRQAVSRWESDSAKPDADKIIAICDLFGVSADYLLRDQYSGEGGAALLQTQETAVPCTNDRGIRRRRMAWIICLAGGIMLLVLKAVYVFVDNYYITHLGDHFTSYFGFLLSFELIFLWGLSCAAFAGGAIYLILRTVIRKREEKNPENQE